MNKLLRDENIGPYIRDAVRMDYVLSDMTVKEIAMINNVCIRSVYSWTKGLRRNNVREPEYIQMRLTYQDIDDLLLAVMEAEKVYKDDILTRLNILEDRLASRSEELYKRNNT
jgi:hypothetical protein